VASRISPEVPTEIERLAARLGVPPSRLIRGWILSGLNAHKDQAVQSTIERIAADLQRPANSWSLPETVRIRSSATPVQT
jgi:hypothetical protein